MAQEGMKWLEKSTHRWTKSFRYESHLMVSHQVQCFSRRHCVCTPHWRLSTTVSQRVPHKTSGVMLWQAFLCLYSCLLLFTQTHCLVCSEGCLCFFYLQALQLLSVDSLLQLTGFLNFRRLAEKDADSGRNPCCEWRSCNTWIFICQVGSKTISSGHGLTEGSPWGMLQEQDW